ncbi:hypothetical protein LTR22_004074 [Elasticomyces elasticus]|nr:hypothetical protein LTR22_004074 [Elasticomyces elasticus]KAK4931603.1 hypothetical protein LTR49_001993 [Elasticomyces elasticus]KAK5766762.1 hypothetical protein LTS12_003113 [Elasticomyces elasticus]
MALSRRSSQSPRPECPSSSTSINVTLELTPEKPKTQDLFEGSATLDFSADATVTAFDYSTACKVQNYDVLASTKMLGSSPDKDNHQDAVSGVMRFDFALCYAEDMGPSRKSGQTVEGGEQDWHDGSGKTGEDFCPVTKEDTRVLVGFTLDGGDFCAVTKEVIRVLMRFTLRTIWPVAEEDVRVLVG